MKIGGDSSLSPLGQEYARRLAEFARMVVCGGATGFECLTVHPREAPMLRPTLSRVPASGHTRGVFAKGNWGRHSGSFEEARQHCGVHEGMRLVRMQIGYGNDFQDVPGSIEEVVRAVETADAPVTFIFIGDPGEVPTLGKAHPTGSQGPPTGEEIPARLWTSSLRRTKETAQHIPHSTMVLPGGKVWEQMSHRIYRNLDEVYAGEFEGLTYEEIKKRAPEEAALRKVDKLGYRYPRGESYYDIIARLDLPIQQLETFHEPTLIVGHQAVHRLVYAFLAGIAREEATELSIPLHTVIMIACDGAKPVTGLQGHSRMEERRFFLGPVRLVEDDGQKHL